MPKIHRTIPQLPTQDIKRFWSKVDIRGLSECWSWQGSFRSNKAGQEYDDFSYKHKHFVASRVAYFLHYGVDLGSEQACHRCDNPPCCNPNHLFAGTQKVNREDAVTKGRTATGDRNGARLYSEKMPRGEANGNSRLTAGKVAEMRGLFDSGEVTVFTTLGPMFLVSEITAAKVVRRETWKHIVP